MSIEKKRERKNEIEVINAVPEMTCDEKSAAMSEIEARLFDVFSKYISVNE